MLICFWRRFCREGKYSNPDSKSWLCYQVNRRRHLCCMHCSRPGGAFSNTDLQKALEAEGIDNDLDWEPYLKLVKKMGNQKRPVSVRNSFATGGRYASPISENFTLCGCQEEERELLQAVRNIIKDKETVSK